MSIAHVWMAGRLPLRKEFYLSLNPLKSHGVVLVGGGAAGKSLGGVSTKLTVSCFAEHG